MSNPASGIILPLGVGAGYYFSSIASNGTQYPLPTFNNLSSSYYLSTGGRDTILRSLGADPSLYFTVRSNVNSHEFTSTYNPSADLSRMYFKLDLSSVGDILNPTSNYGLVSQVSATYSRLSDAQAIEHSRNVGLNTVTVNIDYRDQFLIYANESGLLSYTSNEYNFRSLNLSTTLNANVTILRNIPQAVILAPGNGSYHNPFNAESTLQDYSNSTVTRYVGVQPNFYRSNREVDQPRLEQDRLYFEVSTNHYGLWEQTFDPDFHGFLYTYNPSSDTFRKSYYSNNEYSDTQPASSLRSTSIEGKVVKLINNLSDQLKTYFSGNPGIELFGFLTWYDVYRRLNANDIGKLMFSNFNLIRDRVIAGIDGNYPIRDVLQTPTSFVTGIPDQLTIANDLIILSPENRFDAIKTIYPQ